MIVTKGRGKMKAGGKEHGLNGSTVIVQNSYLPGYSSREGVFFA